MLVAAGAGSCCSVALERDSRGDGRVVRAQRRRRSAGCGSCRATPLLCASRCKGMSIWAALMRDVRSPGEEHLQDVIVPVDACFGLGQPVRALQDAHDAMIDNMLSCLQHLLNAGSADGRCGSLRAAGTERGCVRWACRDGADRQAGRTPPTAAGAQLCRCVHVHVCLQQLCEGLRSHLGPDDSGMVCQHGFLVELLQDCWQMPAGRTTLPMS